MLEFHIDRVVNFNLTVNKDSWSFGTRAGKGRGIWFVRISRASRVCQTTIRVFDFFYHRIWNKDWLGNWEIVAMEAEK